MPYYNSSNYCQIFMMAMSLSDFVHCLGGACTQRASLPDVIRHLLHDTRYLVVPHQSAFFALRGERTDGHSYLAQAYEAGVRVLVVAHDAVTWQNRFPDALWIEVPDPLAAMLQVARRHKEQCSALTVAITGAFGKSTIKEWLSALLSADFLVMRTPRNYNSPLGVAHSLWHLQSWHQIAIVEVSAVSSSIPIPTVAAAIAPQTVVLTNNRSLPFGLMSAAQHLEQQMKLAATAQTILYCHDHADIAAAVQKLPHQIQRIAWSEHDLSPQGGPLAAEVLAAIGGRVTQPYALENALHCYHAARHLGLSHHRIIQLLTTLPPPGLPRMEWQAGVQRTALLLDSANTDLHALAQSLQTARNQHPHQPLTVLLQFPECIPLISIHYLLTITAQYLEAASVHRLVGIGSLATQLQPLLPNTIQQQYFLDTLSLLQGIDIQSFSEQTVLIRCQPDTAKAVLTVLAKQTHRTVLEINLSAITHNVLQYRHRLLPSTRIMAMVKAAAYGAGLDEVALHLEQKQLVNYLAVAYTDEGVSLRQSGCRLPIVVLNPESAAFESLVRYRLEPEVYSPMLLEQLEQHLYSSPPPQPLSIHIKLETGMYRLGFEEHHLGWLATRLRNTPNMRVASVFSHLAASESAELDTFTHRQYRRFEGMCATLTEGLGYIPLRHLLNSAGIVRHPQYQMDMVRLGIGLYGIGNDLPLLPVATLKAVISQIKCVPAGHSVGYGCSDVAPYPRRIATISIGYADGFSRRLSNGKGAVLVAGQFAPVVGRVCMDMSMVDVTHMPQVQEGDTVVVFGTGLPLTQFADSLDTIAYEALTAVSARVKRVFY